MSADQCRLVLRAPLTILRGQAEVALRSEDADVGALRAALTVIVQKTDHMGRMVDDLLFLARSESGSIMVNRTDVVLQEIIGDVLMDGQNLHKRDGVRIRPSQPEEPVVVLGDPDRLRQAILITLDNAIRLAPRGTTVNLDLRQSGDRGIVRIRDEGPGFTSEQLGSAFTRFNSGAPHVHAQGAGWVLACPSRNGSWTSMMGRFGSTAQLTRVPRSRFRCPFSERPRHER